MAIICIDAGHGGRDKGGQSLGTPESRLVLPYALSLGKELQALGHRVVYTRTTDEYPTLSKRATIANEAAADLFVSVHANASADPQVRGPWTIHAAGSEAGKRFATAAQRALVTVLGGSRNAIYPDASPWVGNRRLAVLRQTRMPAILVELGFMTSPKDLDRLEDEGIRGLVCIALASVLHSELAAEQAPPPPPPPNVEVPVLSEVDFPAPRIVVPALPRPTPPHGLDLEPKTVPVYAPALKPSGWRRFLPWLNRSGPMETVVQAKPWYLSKTVWFNVLTMLAAMLGALSSFVATLPFQLPAGLTATIGFLIAAVNLLLRFFTDKPVASKSKPVVTG